nr:MAG TPA: hypothetical protein [Bacteriophage sp.]
MFHQNFRSKRKIFSSYIYSYFLHNNIYLKIKIFSLSILIQESNHIYNLHVLVVKIYFHNQ